MKVLHINISDVEGGATRAAYRIHKALLKEGIDSQMLVHSKGGDDYTVQSVWKTKLGVIFKFLRPYLDVLPIKKYKNRTKTPFSAAWVPFSKVVDRINEINPDIVHLHWICGGMLRIEDLAKIKQPIVWTLHDMWAFTGGEHYDEGQAHYTEKCGNSKVLNSHKENDLSRKGWERKNKTYQRIKSLNIIAPSRWLYNESKKSSLLKNKPHYFLPYVLDTDIFKPVDKNVARDLWHLPKDKKLILFGAMNATGDKRKGYDLLLAALKQLKREDVEIIVFGSSAPKEKSELPFKIHYTGRLYDDISLATLYSCADVMIVPSRQDNLVQTALESICCGTPVVAFNTTGQPDIIDHKINGYLAQPFDSEDLKNGIEWVLDNENYETLSKNAREKALTHFAEGINTPKQIEIYKEVLNLYQK